MKVIICFLAFWLTIPMVFAESDYPFSAPEPEKERSAIQSDYTKEKELDLDAKKSKGHYKKSDKQLTSVPLDYGSEDHKNIDNGQDTLHVYSLYAAAKPSLELGAVKMYAKLGFHNWNEDWEYHNEGNQSFNDEQWGTIYGVGMSFDSTKDITLATSYTTFEVKQLEYSAYIIDMSIKFPFKIDWHISR
ncbi:hypothetical protein N9R79_00005 [Vibrio sp.]|nr:hypothetical protein [Vibrio sp.]